jgi:hypothetical protein
MIKPARRTLPIARRILILAGVLIAVAAVPANASAAVRTLSIEDPQGDASALSGPVLDLKALDVRYDDGAGTLRVVWTYWNDVRAGQTDPSAPWSQGMFNASSPLVFGATQDYVGANWSGGMRWVDAASSYSWSASADLYLGGSSGSLPGTVTVSQDGHVVTAEFSHTLLAGKDLQYTWGGSVMSGDAFGEMTNKFWFDGYSDPHPPVYPPTYPPAPGPPPPGHSGGANADQGMTVNGGALYTNDPDVTLSVIAPGWANTLRVANDGGFRGAKTFPVKKTIRWRLAESGPERLPKTVYLRFGNDAQNFTDDIILDQTNPTVSSAVLGGAGAAATSASVAQAAGSKGRTYRVRIRAKDATSGVAKVQFAASKRRPGALLKFSKVSRFQGSRPRYVRVQDRAGNFSSWRSIR